MDSLVVCHLSVETMRCPKDVINCVVVYSPFNVSVRRLRMRSKRGYYNDYVEGEQRRTYQTMVHGQYEPS